MCYIVTFYHLDPKNASFVGRLKFAAIYTCYRAFALTQKLTREIKLIFNM